MNRHLPKAERMFQHKLNTALAPHGYIFIPNEGDMEAPPEDWFDDLRATDDEMLIHHWRADCFDFNYIAELFRQYGAYLLLIEDDNDVSVETDTERNRLIVDGVRQRLDGERAIGHVQSEQENGIPEDQGLRRQTPPEAASKSEATETS